MGKRKSKLSLLWRNLKFLTRRELRSDLVDFVGCRCKLADMLKGVKMPNILDFEETARVLAETDVSIARFGDGEFALMQGRGIPFQRADARLAARLAELLAKPPSCCLVGVPRLCWFDDRRFCAHDNLWWLRYMKTNGAWLESQMAATAAYCDSYVSLFSRATVLGYDVGGMFDRLRRIWAGKNVLIVCGKGIFDGFEYDVFDNAQSVEFVYGPKRDAFSDYDALLARVKVAAKGRLVLIVLGPTATVMAADLAAAGIRALDLGHLAKAYNAFRKGVKANQDFYRAD